MTIIVANAFVGDSATALGGFYGATPVAQPHATNQALVSTATITAVVTTASTATSPVGYTTTAQANAIPVAINSLVTAVAALVVLANQIETDLIALGLSKGSN